MTAGKKTQSGASKSLRKARENRELKGAGGPDETAAACFPIVGIGASAGGLKAFETFFSGMPADPGMAFVLVQHLAPDHKSILTDLIRRYTCMQVVEVKDGMTVQPNCTYIIPPNRDMAILNGVLQLMEPSAPRGQRLPIDFFFRSLARDLRERAIGIVLSGTGSDGALGVRAIKGEGGMVMVQTPASTDYDGMPLSAIATGLVDFELLPAEMPVRIIAYVAHAFGKIFKPPALPAPETENALKKIFILLRAHTGHDFSQYKPSTIHRRIERRMALQQIDTMDGYVKYLQRIPAEVEALFRDLLIGVTSFFRDPEAFKALEEKVIPWLFTANPSGAKVRVWTPGCATGEEAYSIAILLHEHIETLRQSFKVQVFATDIDSHAIATARMGLYPASIADDLSPERLARFFDPEPGGSGYRAHKCIRDMIVFSEQNVIKDPPFSKLDLISCRNLLIYMGGDLQKKLIPLFHYALNPGGILFLGNSETVGDFGDLFSPLDRKLKLYQRKETLHTGRRSALGGFLPPMTPPEEFLPSVHERPAVSRKPPLREITEQALLHHAVPAAVLVNGNGDILYLHGRTGLYLEPAPGEMGVNNILKMAREGLRLELAAALQASVLRKEVVGRRGLRVKTNGDYTLVDLIIRPVKAIPGPARPVDASMFLVILDKVPPPGDKQQKQPPVPDAVSPGEGHGALPGADAEAQIMALRQELQAKEEYLQTIREELETSNEELKSTNEEMQSVNEELQSTNEELETSKEELQSVNEELTTVNGELQVKVTDLSQANNDMNNLLAGTGIGTIFVDLKLCILRFTPPATQVINLIATDIGRPLGHIVSKFLNYDRLIEDIESVLCSLIPKEVEVQTRTGEWYLLGIRPYRTLENVIEGAVITFVDVSELKKVKQSLKESAIALHRLAVVVRDAGDAITVQDLEGRILAWNPAAERIYGWSEAEALALNIRDRLTESNWENELARLKQVAGAEILAPYRTQRLTKDGRVMNVWMTATALVNDAGKVRAIATTERLIP